MRDESDEPTQQLKQPTFPVGVSATFKRLPPDASPNIVLSICEGFQLPSVHQRLPIGGRTASFLVVDVLLTVEGADGGELLDAPNFGGGWSTKKSGPHFLQ
jgi:hypothetical protein